jgi:hypothetical protein
MVKKRKAIFLAGLTLLSLLLAVVSLSCQPEPVTSTVVSTTTRTTTQTATVTSTATTTATTTVTTTVTGTTTAAIPRQDGVISVGEYGSSASFADGNYVLYWESDAQYVYMGVKAKTAGFIAIGFPRGFGLMIGADAVLCFVKDGMATIQDVHIVDRFFGVHPQDTEKGGTNDLMNPAAKEEGGFTTLEFQRKLKTTDTYDFELLRGVENNIIWSYGSQDSLGGAHEFRGAGKIVI